MTSKITPEPLQSNPLDALLDDLADRVTARVLARLGPRNSDEWLTAKQIKADYGISYCVLAEAAARGDVTVHKLGDGPKARIRVRRSAVEQWIESRQVAKKEKPAEGETPEAAYLKLVGGQRRG